jgi:phage shock protein A
MGRNIFDPQDRAEVPDENLGGLYEEPQEELGTELEYLEKEIEATKRKLTNLERKWLHLKRKKNTL